MYLKVLNVFGTRPKITWRDYAPIKKSGNDIYRFCYLEAIDG